MRGALHPDHESRRTRALESLLVLREGEGAQRVAADLERDYGVLGSYLVDFSYGELWSRPQLAIRDRILVAIAMLSARGPASRIASYAQAGLRHGIEPDALAEIVSQVGTYSGLYRGMEVMDAFRRVIGWRGHEPAETLSDEERRRRGANVFACMNGETVDDPEAVLASLTERFGDSGPMGWYGIEYGLGDVWGRPQLQPRDRSLVVLSALVTLGRDDEIEIHVPIAFQHGVTREELEELVLMAMTYAGLPFARRAMLILSKFKDF